MKWGKVNQGLSFEQKYNMLESPMLHNKFRRNWPLIPRKKILKGLYHMCALQPSWSYDQHHVKLIFIFVYLKASKQNLVNTGSVVSEKSKFYF